MGYTDQICHHQIKQRVRMQEWKQGRSCMPTKVVYQPEPPPLPESESRIDLSKYPMRLVKVQVDQLQKGFKKYKFELPNATRLQYHNHPIFGPDWTRAIQDFDGRFLVLQFRWKYWSYLIIESPFYCNHFQSGSQRIKFEKPRFSPSVKLSPASTAVVAAASQDPDQMESELLWPNEPTDLDTMLNVYAVEHKFAGRVAGTTLYVTSSDRKDGVSTEVQPGQTKKLWLVTCHELMFRCCCLRWQIMMLPLLLTP